MFQRIVSFLLSLVLLLSSVPVQSFAEETAPTEQARILEQTEVPEETVHQHIWEEGDVTAAGCDTAGYTTYLCPDCGESCTGEEVPALGHSWGEWAVTLEPTAEAEGARLRVCALCAAEESEALAILPAAETIPETSEVTLPEEETTAPSQETVPAELPLEEEAQEPVEEEAETIAQEPAEGAAYGIVDFGTCGDNLTWVLDEEGLLTISGTGPMKEYSGNYIFPWENYRDQILSVHMEDGITYISSFAFDECTNLVTVKIPDTVTGLGGFVFCDSESLTYVYVPDSVETMSQYAFYQCPKLSIYCEAPQTGAGWDGGWNGNYNTAYYSVLESDFDYWISCSWDKTTTAVEIPEGITMIPEKAFYEFAELEEVRLPSTLKFIGAMAFYGCAALENIYIPESVTTIDAWNDSLFYGCSANLRIWCGAESSQSDWGNYWNSGYYNVTYYGVVLDDVPFYSALTGTESSVVIPEGTATIPVGFFEGNAALESVTIPASVKTIGKEAFYNCKNLKTITFGHSAQNALTIGDFAFTMQYYSYDPCDTLIRVPYLRQVHPAIAGCDWSFRELSWEETGTAQFTAISLAEMNGITRIQAGLDLNIQATLDPAYATEKLIWTAENGEVVSTDHLSCTAVVRGDQAGILTVRCTGADSGVFNEIQIAIDQPTEIARSIEIRSGGEFVNEVEVGTTVPMKVEFHPGNVAIRKMNWSVINATGTATIDENGNLTMLTPGTVTVRAKTTDGSSLTASCTVTGVRYVQDITILVNGQTDVATLGVGETAALRAKVSPEDATVQDVTWSVTDGTGTAKVSGDRVTGGTPGTITVTATAADNRANTASVTLEVTGEGRAYAVTGGNIYYNTETGYITDCDDTVTSADIPGIIDGTVIRGIAPEAFVRHNYGIAYNKTLTSVSIPDSVTYIGERAFYCCSALTYVDLGEGVREIGWEAFRECSSLANLTIPDSVQTIGDYAFYYLYGLKHLTLSGTWDTRPWLGYSNTLESVTFTGTEVCGMEIQENGYYESIPGRNAKKVILADSVRSVGSYAFYSRYNLQEVEVGNGVTTIGEHAFEDCDDLKTVTLGNSVAEIGTSAFAYCNSLESIDLGTGLVTVGDQAFWNCDNLTELTFPDGTESLGKEALANCDKLVRVTLPQTMTYLGESAMAQCNNLEFVNLPDSLTYIGKDCFDYSKKLQLLTIDLPDKILVKETSLANVVEVPSVLISATNGRTDLEWSLEAVNPEDRPYDIAGLYSRNNGKTWYLKARGTGQVRLVCRDIYTGAQGSKVISLETGIEIRGVSADYLTAGQSLTLTAWRMPDNVKEHVSWSLREGDSAYATLSTEYGNTVELTAKSISRAAEIELTAWPNGNAEPAVVKLWIVPKATGVTILHQGESIGATGSSQKTVAVDMHADKTMELDIEMQPVDAADAVTWKSSDTKIATVSSAGVVTMKKPGSVTITATTKDGTKKSASVKLTITYLDKASKLTASVEGVPSIGLQEGNTAALHVFGTDKTIPLQPGDLKYTSSNTSVATVDENGVITAGAKAGTVTITAAIDGDPLKREITAKVKVIAAQTEQLILVPEEKEDMKVLMLDESGVVTEDIEQAVTYQVLLDQQDLTAGAYSFRIQADSLNTIGQSSRTGYTWSVNDANIASIKDNKDGSVVVTVKANASGACVISAVTTDLVKLEKSLLLVARNYAPRLESASLTLNPRQTAGVSTALLESYGNAIAQDGVSVEDTRLTASWAEGVLTVTPNGSLKDGTIKTVLSVQTEDFAEPFRYNLKITVKNSLPELTVKQSGKFNLFYRDSAVELGVTASKTTVTGISVKDPQKQAFAVSMDDAGKIRLTYSDAYLRGEIAKVNTKLTLQAELEGYSVPVTKSFTVSTATVKPSLKLNRTSSTINTALTEDRTVSFGVYDKTTGEQLALDEDLVQISASFADWELDDAGTVTLALLGNAGGKATLKVRYPNWMGSVDLSHKVTVKTVLPKVNLGTATLQLNRIFSAKEAETTVSLDHTNLILGGFVEEEFVSTSKDRAQAEKLLVYYDSETENIVAKIRDTDAVPKAGTYTFTGTPHLDDGTMLAKVKVTVKVSGTAPKVKLGSSTLKLNRYLQGEETVTTTVSVSSGYELEEFADLEAQSIADLTYADGVLYAVLREGAAKKTHSLKLTPVVKDKITGQQVELSKITLKLTVYESKKLSLALASSGKLDTLKPDSTITYTIKKRSNVTGNPDNIWLEGAAADLFEYQTNERNTAVTLSMKQGVEYATNKTYAVTLVFDICGRQIRSAQKIKVTQSALKMAAVKELKLYHSCDQVLSAQLRLSSPAGAQIGRISLSSKTDAKFRRALGEMKYEISDDGRIASVAFDVAQPGYLPAGKSYTVWLDVTPVNNATNVKPLQVKLTVKVSK